MENEMTTDNNEQVTDPTEISYEDFVKLVKDAVGSGRCTFRIGISLYRNGGPEGEDEKDLMPDIMSMAKIDKVPDYVAEMLWNSLYTSIESFGMQVYALVASPAEGERIKEQQAKLAQSEAANDSASPVNPNLH
jgi:hypothetical protein